MSDIGQYILSIICAAIIVSVISSLLDPKSHISPYVKLLGSLFLTIVALAPLLNLHFENISEAYSSIYADSQNLVLEGEDTAYSQKLAIIKEQIEAYILEKASTLGIDITVDIGFPETGELSPNTIQVHGAISPYSKKQLSAIIANDLGIAEDRQLWY